jgi:hypothetical protein
MFCPYEVRMPENSHPHPHVQHFSNRTRGQEQIRYFPSVRAAKRRAPKQGLLQLGFVKTWSFVSENAWNQGDIPLAISRCLLVAPS